MVDTFRIATPQYLRIGAGTASTIVDDITKRNFKKPMLIIDPKVRLTKKGLDISSKIKSLNGYVFDNISSNPRCSECDESIDIFNNLLPDCVIAIGGGSAIDLAKVTILAGLNGGKAVDYLNGKKGNKKFPPFFIIPTTCGTGSEASPFAVINDTKKHQKRGIEDYSFLPEIVIIDPELLLTLERHLVASTGIDALAHVIEAYVSKKANNLTRKSAKGLLPSFISSLEKAAFEFNITALQDLMENAFTSRLLYPRTGLTIAHALSHPMGAYTDVHHGLAVANFLIPSLKFNYDYCTKPLLEVCDLLGFSDFAKFTSWFSDYCENTKMVSAYKQSLMGKKMPIDILAKDTMSSSNIPSNPRSVAPADLEIVIKNSLNEWGITY